MRNASSQKIHTSSLAYYERYWEDQEELSDFPYKWPVIKPYIPTKKNIKILDFGTGKGKILGEMQKVNPFAHFFGVDVSQKALTINKKKHPQAIFKKIRDGGKLSFNDCFFDFIIASDVLEHIYDTENAYAELSRVLKKNGKILISVPYNGFFKRIIIALFFFDMIFEPSTPHIRFYTRNNLEKWLSKVGIKIIHTGYYGRFFPLSSGMFAIAIKK